MAVTTDEVFANWFLTADERGNDSTAIDRRHPDGLAWTSEEGRAVDEVVDAVPNPDGRPDRLRHAGDW
jgi:hypothetical protein